MGGVYNIKFNPDSTKLVIRIIGQFLWIDPECDVTSVVHLLLLDKYTDCNIINIGSDKCPENDDDNLTDISLIGKALNEFLHGCSAHQIIPQNLREIAVYIHSHGYNYGDKGFRFQIKPGCILGTYKSVEISASELFCQFEEFSKHIMHPLDFIVLSCYAGALHNEDIARYLPTESRILTFSEHDKPTNYMQLLRGPDIDMRQLADLNLPFLEKSLLIAASREHYSDPHTNITISSVHDNTLRICLGPDQQREFVSLVRSDAVNILDNPYMKYLKQLGLSCEKQAQVLKSPDHDLVGDDYDYLYFASALAFAHNENDLWAIVPYHTLPELLGIVQPQ